MVVREKEENGRAMAMLHFRLLHDDDARLGLPCDDAAAAAATLMLELYFSSCVLLLQLELMLMAAAVMLFFQLRWKL